MFCDGVKLRLPGRSQLGSATQTIFPILQPKKPHGLARGHVLLTKVPRYTIAVQFCIAGCASGTVNLFTSNVLGLLTSQIWRYSTDLTRCDRAHLRKLATCGSCKHSKIPRRGRVRGDSPGPQSRNRSAVRDAARVWRPGARKVAKNRPSEGPKSAPRETPPGTRKWPRDGPGAPGRRALNPPRARPGPGRGGGPFLRNV